MENIVDFSASFNIVLSAHSSIRQIEGLCRLSGREGFKMTRNIVTAAALAVGGLSAAARSVGAQVVIPSIVDFAPGVPSQYSPQLTAPAGTATFTPGSSTSTAITVTPLGGGNYIPGFAHIVAPGGATEGYFALSGFKTSDTADVALRLMVSGADPTASQISQVISDINTAADAEVASTVPTAYVPLIGGSYDILVTFPPIVGNEPYASYFAFDFGTEKKVQGMSASDVAILSPVPEPSAAAAFALSVIMFVGRRLRRLYRRPPQ